MSHYLVFLFFLKNKTMNLLLTKILFKTYIKYQLNFNQVKNN